MNLAEHIRRAVMKARGRDPDFIAIVLLLHKLSHPLAEEKLKGAVRRAWDVDWSHSPEKAHVTSKKNATFVAIEGHMLNLLAASRPYINQKEEVAKRQRDPRVRETILKHSAWMSVDYVRGSKPKAATMAERYRWAAKLAAELVDENCLGVCIPEEEVIVPFSAELQNGLREFDTVQGFAKKYLSPTATAESFHKLQS